MSTIGQKIYESRKAKGLTQEELAGLSKVNLRTIQRIENNENTPRGSTLNILCEVLQIEREDVQPAETPRPTSGRNSRIINGIFLVLLNLMMMSAFGYLTLDSEANLNSRVGAFLLSIFMPLIIVAKTQNIDAVRRVLHYGTGFLLYILLAVAMVGVPVAFVTGLIPSLLIALAVLYYGNWVVNATSTTP